MAITLGGDRYIEEMTPLNDDWYAWKIEQDKIDNPLDDDYVPEEYREVEY